MKVNVKGFMFAGFAAMMFAGMANANDDRVVTSKAYVDGLVAGTEKVANKTTSVTSESTDTQYPSAKAVHDYVQSELDTIALDSDAAYQAKATADYQVSKSDGTWQSLDTAVSTTSTNGITNAAITTYVDGQNELDEKVANKTTTISDNAENASDVKYPSEKAVKTYVDTAIDALGDTADDMYQQKSNANYQVGKSDGSWAGLDAAVSAGDYVAISKDDTTGVVTVGVDSATVAGADTDVTSGSTKLTTANAVYDYVQGLPSAAIPAKPATCTDVAPCTLVAVGDSFQWIAIAQPE